MKTQGDRYYVTGSELRSVMSHLQREGTYFLAGSNSIYVPRGKVKYLDKSACKPWPDLENEVGLMGPGEAVRTELAREWPDLTRVGWSGKQVVLLNARSPLHYTGQYSAPLIYVDLVAAYNQIYEKLWLDTTFPRAYYGRYPLWAVANRLKIWKSARNSLVGVCRSRDAVAYRGMKRVTIKMKNKYLSPGLWGTVQGILHWIASEAVNHGAIYVNVDGYIFHEGDGELADRFLLFLSDLGIRWSIRAQGQGEIVSWNNYRIGHTQTQAYKLGLIQNSKEFSNVNHKNSHKWAAYWIACRRIHRVAVGNESERPAEESNLHQADSGDGTV